jgi:ATP/maltotriose-dependent transcriptional regulator MalT
MIRRVAQIHLVEMDRVAEVRRAHAMWVASTIEDIDKMSAGPSEADVVANLDRIRNELAAAVQWSVETGNIEIAGRIAASLAGPLWFRPDVGLIDSIERVAGQRSIEGASEEAAVMAAAARTALLTGRLDLVDGIAHRALQTAHDDDSPTRHRACHALGTVCFYRAEPADALRWFDEVIEDPTASIRDRLDALGGLGISLRYAGDSERAQAIVDEYRALATTVGSEAHRAYADYVQAEVNIAEGDLAGGSQLLEAAAARAWQHNAPFVWGVAATVLAAVLVRSRPPAEARAKLPILIERWRRTGTWTQLWFTLRLTAEHLVATGDPQSAFVILDAADNDPASPALSEGDAALYNGIRRRIVSELSDAEVKGLRSGAAALDRGAVTQCALDALRKPIEPTSGGTSGGSSASAS